MVGSQVCLMDWAKSTTQGNFLRSAVPKPSCGATWQCALHGASTEAFQCKTKCSLCMVSSSETSLMLALNEEIVLEFI